MLSALLTSRHSYPALHLETQLEHQRSVHPGPLVLRTGPLKSPAPTLDRDRTVSRRTEPNSRTTIDRRTAEPLGPASAPGCDESTSVPNLAVDMNSWARSACYPRRTFYPLSDGPSIRDHRITITCFRTCSSCLTRSQAPLYYCALRLISKQPEGTFVRLRYALGGDRPSQTTRLTLSSTRITGAS